MALLKSELYFLNINVIELLTCSLYLVTANKKKKKKKKKKKSKRKVQGVPQSQTAALPRHQEKQEINKTKQAQIEQTYENIQVVNNDLLLNCLKTSLTTL